MSGSPRNKLGLAFALLWLLLAPHASAQSADAEALFNQGRVELAQGNYAAACDKLRQSDELDPAPGTKLNLGECEALRGRVATAYRLFVTVEQQLSANDVRLPIARSKREAVEPRLPKLKITLAQGAPRDTRVRIGEQVLDASAFDVENALDPGAVELVVTAVGFAENRVQVTLEEAKTLSVEVQPLPLATKQQNALSVAMAPGATPEQAVPIVATRALNRASSSPRSKGLVSLGFGISVTALSGVFGILTLRAKSDNQTHCDEEAQSCDSEGRDAANRGRIFGALTTAGLVAGAVGIGLGTYWIVSGDGERRSATKLTLRSDGTNALVVVQRRFE